MAQNTKNRIRLGTIILLEVHAALKYSAFPLIPRVDTNFNCNRYCCAMLVRLVPFEPMSYVLVRPCAFINSKNCLPRSDITVNVANNQEINRAVIADRSSTIRRALAGRSIVLVGIMGVGKSTIGKRLSQYLDIPFVDADKEIEKAAGMTVQDIFDQFGEKAFRDGEQKVIKRLMGESQCILATGGGAFINEGIREDVKAGGVSVWLDASLDILMKRVQRRSDRPLLKTPDPEATMKALLEERNPYYAMADVKIESRTVSRDVIAAELVDLLADALPAVAEERDWK